MDNAKIESALGVLDGLPSDARFGGNDWTMWRTGLTVADLRELLEAARDDGWLDAETDPPPFGEDVLADCGRMWRKAWRTGRGWAWNENPGDGRDKTPPSPLAGAAAMTPRPAVRRIRDEPCESCARRTDVAIFDDAIKPCPRLCADCMRAGLEVLR